ncbi:hypothetical protein [Williamsia sterculiae]|uniref:Uncharacterized protein n=1 Tax=Williamsia sterculiae TaxID=1344003 RepID=A0A1N7CLR6_9NOCA|nr:hypothetical protein [Williamsia sterculiae]SIR64354.1 hypothetical protein SAMN05445060_0210 [Williamsia sterculiae]
MTTNIDLTYPAHKGEVVEERQTPAYGWIAVTIMTLVVLIALMML